jgi:hypothetical protein
MKILRLTSYPKQTLLTVIAVVVATIHLRGRRGGHILETNVAGHLHRGGWTSITGALKSNTSLREEPLPALLIKKLENPLHVPPIVDEERPGVVLLQP